MLKYIVLGVIVAGLVVVGLVLRSMFMGVVVASGKEGFGVKTKALAFTVKDIDGQPCNLGELKGKVVLIVNVASRCGFTKQYAGLEALYQRYKDAGLVVLAFPANDFGSQEPGTDQEIKAFCSSTYQVTFPVMAKSVITGADKCEVYRFLTEQTGAFGGEVKWNFTKFLIARDGETLLGRFASAVRPDDAEIAGAVEAALGAK